MMHNTMMEVTAITVSYNTRDLLERAVNSFRRFHPDMKLIIVDGSDKTNDCYDYVSHVYDENTMVMLCGSNIGHAEGMKLGIKYCQTRCALIFDSDIEILDSPVKQMLKMMRPDTFGCGWIFEVGRDGFDYGCHESHKNEPPVKYLHPFFQLIDIENYKKYKPYQHHGAPCYQTMNDIADKGLSDKILIQFPGLWSSSGMGINWQGKPCKYVEHKFGGTRMANKQAGKKEIEGVWIK